MTGDVEDVNVTLNGVTHTNPDDIDVLLVAPNGDNVRLMADVGGGGDLSGVDLTFDDEAAGQLPDSTQIISGTYRPSKGGDSADTFPNSGEVEPFGTELSVFDGDAPSGQWSLYIRDDAAQNTGQIARGYSITIETDNDAPVVDSVKGDTVDEGETATVTVNATDSDGDTLTYDFDCDADSDYTDAVDDQTTSPDNTGNCTFDDDGTYRVPVRVTDDDGATDTDTATVTVRNVSPTVEITGDNAADEGDIVTYEYTVTEPGDDPITPDTQCGVNGVEDENSNEYDPATGEGSFECVFPDGPANSEVSVSVDDGDGGDASDSIVVQIANVAPQFDLTGDATANEGQTRTYTYIVDDPGDDETEVVSESCGVNATHVDTPATNSFDCTFTDGGAGKFSNVSVSATDSDGAEGSDSIRVDVANVKPSVTLTGPGTTDEGETETYTFNVTDPGSTDTHTAVAACGDDGELVDGSLEYSNQTREGSFDCLFPNGDETTNVTVRVTDSDGAQDTDNRVVTVTIDNVPPEISAIEDQTIEEDGTTGPIPFTVEDVDADTVTVTAASSNQDLVQNEDITLGGSGENRTVTVTPDANESGTTTITITADDGTERSTETFTVTVAPVNDAPVADNASQTVAEDGANATFDLGALVSDQETADADITYEIVTGPTQAQGTASITGQTLTFDPADNFSDTVTIVYSATDDGDGNDPEKSDNGTLTINVTPVNDAPTANDDTKTGATAGQPLTFPASDLTANDSAGPGEGNQTLTVTAVGDAQNGTVTLNNGRITFTGTSPGAARFDYTVSDGQGGTDTGTVNLTVGDAPPPNTNPDAVNDSATTNEDNSVTIDVLANDTDDDDLTIQSVGNPPKGTATVINGRVRYTPDTNATGTDTFTYTVSDGNGGTDTATVRVTIRPVNDAPVARNDSAQTRVNRAVNVNVLANDRDVDGGDPRVTTFTQPSKGKVTRNANGTLRFTPDRNFVGTTRFTYTITDGRGGTSRASVTITVRR